MPLHNRPVLGIDPDCHNTALAMYSPGGEVTFLGVAKVDAAYKGQLAAPEMFGAVSEVVKPLWLTPQPLIVMEGQRIRRGGSATKNPQSIVELAAAAGVALGAVKALWPYAPVLWVEPQVWKGSVPKQVHQLRILSRLGWPGEKAGSQAKGYARPKKGSEPEVGKHISRGQWKHVMDAIGMALWGRDQIDWERQRRDRSKRTR